VDPGSNGRDISSLIWVDFRGETVESASATVMEEDETERNEEHDGTYAGSYDRTLGKLN
jgi:hypothetical protein